MERENRMPRTILDTDKYVPALLTFVSNKLSHGASNLYRRKFGVGVTEWRIISLLAVEPKITAQRMCHVIGIDKALTSRTLEILQKANYIRVEPDRDDNRKRTVSLSPSGLKLHDRIIKVALERERLLLTDLTKPEVEILVTLLRRIHASVDAVNAYDPGTPQKS
jgi:DNA-binding MarR family transcriptional regulator